MQNGSVNSGPTNSTLESRIVKPRVIQKPITLIFQLIYFLIILVPTIIISIYKYFITKEKSVRDKTVLVTGGGSGLGREICLKFARKGARIATCDVNEDANDETVQMVKKLNSGALVKGYICNVCSSEDIHKLNEDVKRDFGQVDILVNNAGIVTSSTLLDTDDKYMDLMVDVNLKSHLKMIREFLPDMMKRNSGHIVAIASLSSAVSVINLSLYAATKHGVLALMESLHDELSSIAGNKIQTTIICPYFIRTNYRYSVEWDLRIPELSASFVARNIVSAILKNRRLVSVPFGFYSGLVILRLLPDTVRCILRRIFYVNISPIKVTRVLSSNGMLNGNGVQEK